MSTIVAVKKNGEVAIAADTLSSTYGLKISAQYKVRRQKILCFQDTYLGFVGYSVHKKVFESIIDKHPGDLNFASSRHIFETFNKIHPILKEKFYLTPAEDDTYESSDMRILVANPSGIFQVDEDRHVLELEHFWAIGSGRDFALGAAFQAYDGARSAREIAIAAVLAATEFDPYSALPYTVHTMPLRKEQPVMEPLLI